MILHIIIYAIVYFMVRTVFRYVFYERRASAGMFLRHFVEGFVFALLAIVVLLMLAMAV